MHSLQDFYFYYKNPTTFFWLCFHMERNEREINQGLQNSVIEETSPDNDNLRELSKTIKHQFIQ